MKKIISYILVITFIFSTVISVEPFGSNLKPVPIENSEVVED
jgi:hypothetical protein